MLEQLGLTNYENKVYLTLIELGVSDARTISSESGVPYGRIYDILDSLNSFGIVNEISGRPKKYAVIEPEVAINRLLEKKMSQMKKLQKHADYAIQELNKKYEGKPKDQLVWKVAIGDELYPTYFDLLQESRRQFLGYMEITEHFLEQIDYFEQYIEVVKQMNSKNVKIKILLGVEDFEIINNLVNNAPDLLDMISYADIRYSNSSSLPYSIIDGEKVILKVLHPVHHSEMLAGIYLWQNSLATALKESFHQLWENAKPLNLAVDTT